MEKLYRLALRMMVDACHISEEDIMKRNLEKCVNARYIFFGSICKYYTDTELSQLSSLSRALINKIRNSVDRKARNSYFFRHDFNNFKKRIACLFQ